MSIKTRILVTLTITCIGILFLPLAAKAQESTLQSIDIIAWEDPGDDRTTFTFYGTLPDDAILPATVRFSLPSGFVVKMINEINPETLQIDSDVLYTTTKTEMSTTYYVTVATKRTFVAGFEVEGSIYDRTTEMGDSPIASMMFTPPNDLERITMGFVAPSKDYVGAGKDVTFLGESDTGEIYGIARKNVKEGEMLEFVVAFAPRAQRDAALAEQAASEAEAAHQETFGYWITSPIGLTIAGIGIALVSALALILWLLGKQRTKPSL